MDQKVTYFEQAGEANTGETIKLAAQRCKDLSIKHVVVATSTGETAIKVAGKIHMKSIQVLATIAVFAIVLSFTVRAIDNADLVVHLSFDNAADMARDSSGKGNSGVLDADPEWGPGKSGGGFVQEGKSYIEVPIKIGSEGTIELWFKPDWTGGDSKTYRIFDATFGTKYFFIGVGGESDSFPRNQIGFYTEDAPDKHWHSVVDLNETAMEAGKWYHIAATWKYDGGEVAFYLNGEPATVVDSTANPLGGVPELNAASRIGLSATNYMSAANGANGTIDEFKIYSRVLEPDEIKEAMEARSAIEPVGKVSIMWGRLKSRLRY